MNPATILEQLDPQQRIAATADAGPVAIIAGAGTGKTRTVVHRIAYRAAAGLNDPRAVLAITHSRKAASELRERIALLGVHGPCVRTFHAHALRQLIEVRGRDSVSILDGKSRWQLTRDLARDAVGQVSDAELRDIHDEISWAQTQRIDADHFTDLSRDRSGLDASVVAAIYRAYTSAKASRGVLDFDDLLSEAARDATSGRANTFLGRYEHVTVDEFQDVNPGQRHLLEAWLAGRVDLTVVGDPRQSIYGFSGADPRFLTEFDDFYPNATIVELTKNYRSTAPVLAAANKLASSLSPLEPNSTSEEGDVAVHYAATIDNETDLVVDQLKRWRAKSIPWDDMAVVYRFNSTGARIESALGQAGIPIQMAGGDDSFWDRADVRNVLVPFGAQARNAPDRPGVELLVEVARSTGWDPDLPPDGAGARRERWELVSALVRLCEHIDDTVTAQDLLEHLHRSYAETHIPSRGGVSVGSVHKSKGLEFEGVIVVDATDGVFPAFFAETPDELAEETNIVYVAITRAKRHLCVLSPLKNARKQAATMSPLFAKALGHSPGRQRRSPAGPKLIADQVPAEIDRIPAGSARRCSGCHDKLRGPELKLGAHLDCLSDPTKRAQRDALRALADDELSLSANGIARLLTLGRIDFVTVSNVPGVAGSEAMMHKVVSALR